LEPEQEDFVPAVAWALRQLNAADSERALWMLIGQVHQISPARARADPRLEKKGMPSGKEAYLLTKSSFVFECLFYIFRYPILAVKC